MPWVNRHHLWRSPFAKTPETRGALASKVAVAIKTSRPSSVPSSTTTTDRIAPHLAVVPAVKGAVPKKAPPSHLPTRPLASIDPQDRSRVFIDLASTRTTYGASSSSSSTVKVIRNLSAPPLKRLSPPASTVRPISSAQPVVDIVRSVETDKTQKKEKIRFFNGSFLGCLLHGLDSPAPTIRFRHVFG